MIQPTNPLVNQFIQNYDTSTYQGGKADIGGTSVPLSKLARVVSAAIQQRTISASDANTAILKLKEMKATKDSTNSRTRSISKVAARVFIPQSKRTRRSSAVQFSVAERSMNLLHTSLSLQSRLSGNDSKDYRALLGALEAEIDAQFDDVPMPDGQAVLIHITEDNGFGDVMLAIKCGKALKEQYPNLDIQFSVHTNTVLPQAVIDKVKQSLGDDSTTVFNWDNRPDDLQQPSMVIHTANRAEAEVQETWADFDEPPQELTLKEFGWGISGAESGGLGKASMGIFVDERDFDEASVTNGQGIQSISRQDVAQTILDNQKPEAYAANTNLYVGYSHLPESVPFFINTMVAMNNNNPKNLDFIVKSENHIPGTKWEMKTSDTGISVKETGFSKPYIAGEIKFEDLAHNGVNKIQLVRVKRKPVTTQIELPGGLKRSVTTLQPVKDKNGDFIIESERPINIPDAPKSGKTLRILDLFPIPHSDMLTLLDSSEPEVMVTGNQSASEAISARKTFFYETLPNDKAFSQQMLSFAKESADEFFTENMKKMQIHAGGNSNTQELGVSLRDPAVRKQFQKFGDDVLERKNLAKCLGRRVKRGVIGFTQPNVGKALGELQTISSRVTSKLEEAHDENFRRVGFTDAGAPVLAPDDAFDELVDVAAEPLAFLREMIHSKL